MLALVSDYSKRLLHISEHFNKKYTLIYHFYIDFDLPLKTPEVKGALRLVKMLIENFRIDRVTKNCLELFHTLYHVF